ncbi:hypothetical protein F2Q69_00014700 [Brassica cretica]|uniref:Rad21/Rec8-like protein N-terminal domain-containing protein n=1 Tax=Brassica cretica TaxID=69181 RepID=A0A8S9R2P4_BRACR|nr:hypothetical protein F2Q69_00014700 [Brassica cretica]
MFYSHTHLARKGPLGTVWSAAHLQNRLKKSHYTATNIPKTVDLILFSALRLSGHLLLGVAPVESVTLPQALNLDDFDLEEDDTLQGEFDNHLRSHQDITLTVTKMFYSHTHLARKGPLGTVWSAAHLQNRLKKSHYTATNIPKTVDLILFSALRLSGHLLLGVAPVESVTLPQALNLDDFDLEEDDTLQGEFDNHLRSHQDITLTDQIPTGIDPYVAVTFDEDIFPESSPMDVDQSTEPVRAHHPGDTDVEMAYETEPNNDQADFNIGRSNANSPGSVPEVEIRRDAVHGLSPASHPPFAAEQHNVGVESTLDETLNGKEPNIPNIDEQTDTRIMVPDGHGS